MITVLLILTLTALLALGIGGLPRFAAYARLVAALGVMVAFVVHLVVEGAMGGGTLDNAIDQSAILNWLGWPIYTSDVLSAGLGAWCLLLGGFSLLNSTTQNDSYKPAAGVLTIATLYSLAHTNDLRAFAAQMLLLVPLLWLLNNSALSTQHSAFATGLGAICIMASALVIGRTTGGQYSLSELSLSALTHWPLALIAIGTILWAGLVPVTGWSARGHGGLVQSLVLGIPLVTLILRLQALVTAQGLAGSLPSDWTAFMVALAWAGGLTALVAGAGAIVAAGTPRWTALLTAHALGLTIWALCLDTPAGRYAALAILAAFGAARVTLEFNSALSTQHSALVARLSLAAAPLTAGFVGVWLLAGALAQQGQPAQAIALLGAAVLSACGVALHFAIQRAESQQSLVQNMGALQRIEWLAAATGAIALIAGGVAPGLWLSQVAPIAGIAGGSVPASLPWSGVSMDGGLLAPLPLLGMAALALAGIGWLIGSWMRSGLSATGILLPTALSHLEASPQNNQPASILDFGPGSIQNPKSKIQNGSVPAPVWWLSLVWLEEGLWASVGLLTRLSARIGHLLGRLEGRYYLPLALVLVMIALLAIVR